jgi:AcrR family transcriptional regulator
MPETLPETTVAPVAESIEDSLDPRIRRTRVLLQDALGKLLQEKEFDKISVQDIAESATVNRATFYDHYADKYALLECMVARRFIDLLAARGVAFDGNCGSALRAIVLGVCDYLASLPGQECKRQVQMEPHMEAAVIAVVRRMILDGVERHPPKDGVSAGMLAATLSWAIFGAAKEWVKTPERGSSEMAVEQVMGLLTPLFRAAYAEPAH